MGESMQHYAPLHAKSRVFLHPNTEIRALEVKQVPLVVPNASRDGVSCSRSGLQQLNLSRNPLGDRGVAQLARGLKGAARTALQLPSPLSSSRDAIQHRAVEIETIATPAEAAGGAPAEAGERARIVSPGESVAAESDRVKSHDGDEERPHKRARSHTFAADEVPTRDDKQQKQQQEQAQQQEWRQEEESATVGGLVRLQLRAVEMHGFGAHAISLAVVAPQTIATATPEQRTYCSSVLTLDLSENALGREGACSLLMAIRVRALMMVAGRLRRNQACVLASFITLFPRAHVHHRLFV